jgi:hypothetical protein
MDTVTTAEQCNYNPRAALESKWVRLLAPSYFDLFVVALLVWLFAIGEGWKGLALDGDTGWHIRTGEYILATGSVPQADLFSYSKPGYSWFAWEWLTDVLYAALHGQFGLAGVVGLSGLLICGTAAMLLRQMLCLGANTFVALLLTLLFVGAGSIHYHARPHVFTMFFLSVFAWAIARDRISPTRWTWMLVPMISIWTNMHGGFLAAIAYAGLIAAGIALQGDWRRTTRYLVLTAACAAASLLNPYGIGLHRHIASYLQSDFIKNTIQEFQSPVFRSESSFQYELVLISGLMCAGLLIARRAFAEAFVIGFFAHMSLTSARHVPLYVIVAAPIIAMELTRLWTRWAVLQPRQSIGAILDQLSWDFGAGFRRMTMWLPMGLAAVILLTPSDRWPRDLQLHFPNKMVKKYGDLIAKSRVFATDQWGDYLIYHLYPQQRVFVDGRSDFYGEALCKDYLTLMNAEPAWESVLQRYRFDLILLPVKRPLASALKLSPKWRIVADDGSAILFAQRVQ